MASQFAILCRLSDGETWREIRAPRFDTEEAARQYLQAHYTPLQGVYHRPDVFHGLQPLRVFAVTGGV